MRRSDFLRLAAMSAAAAAVVPSGFASAAPAEATDVRFFGETGFRISDDASSSSVHRSSSSSAASSRARPVALVS
jgi:hypothetical protein